METPGESSPPSIGVHPPMTSSEAITVLVHYYRGELSRMISWRDRLDRTTNWAIAALAAMLSITLASRETHHAVLLFSMLVIHVLLIIEARRYRFFHVYRARIRLLEREYLAPMFGAAMGGTRVGLAALGEDLRLPRFSVSLLQAMARRLKRNYLWIYLVVIMAWLVKTTTIGEADNQRFVHSLQEFLANTAIGGIPGAAVVGGVVALYAWLIFVALRFNIDEDDLGPGQVHV